MFKWLKYSFGQSLPLLVLLSALMFTLSGCGTNPLNLLTGGGPNIAANIQAGKTNSQTVGKTETFAPTVDVKAGAKVETIDQSKTETVVGTSEKVTVNNSPIWLILFAVLGWLLPSPGEIGRWIRRLFKRNAT